MVRAIVAKRGYGRLVRTGATALSYYPPAKRVRYAMRYGPHAIRAGRKIWGMYRKWKKKRAPKSTRRIGERVGSSSAKRSVQLLQALTNRQTRTLYQTRLTQIPFGNNVNERERNVVNVRGFTLCMHFRNDLNVPLYLNVAVVSRKDEGDAAPVVNDFFRGFDNQRATDFGNGLLPLEFHCSPINSDKYHIIRHKRYTIDPLPGGLTYTSEHRNWRNLNWYIPFKRQLRWDQNADNNPIDGNCFLVYWCDQVSAAAGSAPVALAMNVALWNKCYYRATQMCC